MTRRLERPRPRSGLESGPSRSLHRQNCQRQRKPSCKKLLGRSETPSRHPWLTRSDSGTKGSEKSPKRRADLRSQPYPRRSRKENLLSSQSGSMSKWQQIPLGSAAAIEHTENGPSSASSRCAGCVSHRLKFCAADSCSGSPCVTSCTPWRIGSPSGRKILFWFTTVPRYSAFF